MSDTTALSIAFGNQGQKLPLVRSPSTFDIDVGANGKIYVK